MKKSLFWFACFTLFLPGCSKLEDPNSVSISDKLNIIIVKDTLDAKIKDTTAILARVSKDESLVDVSFTVTAGTFIATSGKTIKQLTDSLSGDFRYAKVIYVSDTVPGTVYLTTEALNARTRNTIIVKR